MSGTGFPDEVHAVVDLRSFGRCEVCGDGRVTDHHHRRPRGSGGSRRVETNSAANCLALCHTCHRMVESHRSVALLMGWLLPQTTTRPGAARVMYRGEWRLLDAVGNVLTENGALC